MEKFMTWVLDHTERITIALNILVYALVGSFFGLWATIHTTSKAVAIVIGIVALIGARLSFKDSPVYIAFKWRYDTDGNWQTIYDSAKDKTFVSLMTTRFFNGNVNTTMLNSQPRTQIVLTAFYKVMKTLQLNLPFIRRLIFLSLDQPTGNSSFSIPKMLSLKTVQPTSGTQTIGLSLKLKKQPSQVATNN